MATTPKPTVKAAAPAPSQVIVQPKPQPAVGMLRPVRTLAAGEYQHETLRWTSNNGGVVPVEVSIDMRWQGDDGGPSTWNAKQLTYDIRWQAGQVYDRERLLAWLDSDTPLDGGARIPTSSVPANGVRFRLAANVVDLMLRVGPPDLIGGLNPQLRASIVPVDGLAVPIPVPPVDGYQTIDEVNSAAFADLEGQTEHKPLPLGARAFRVMPTDIDYAASVLIVLLRPDRTVIQAHVSLDVLDWQVIPFDARYLGVALITGSGALARQDVLVEYR